MTELSPTQKTVQRRSKPGAWRISDIIDSRNLRVQLTAAHMDHANDRTKARQRVIDLLHGALFRGRMIAQERLEAGADGLDTANLLSAVMDEVLHALYDYTTVHVIRANNPTMGERMAVMAVGGYGRCALAPSSDVDLLFVRTYKQTAWAESVIEFMLYALWDLGLKVGHAFRTIDECIRLSKEDYTIRTAILDKRLLFGDKDVAKELDDRFDKDIVEGRAAEFVQAKLEERDRRVSREGSSRFRVEPNVKESKGGLRDLQTLFWLAKYIHGGSNFNGVLKNHVFSKSDAAIFRREARFLWTVRCHLHYVAGRAEDRLSFDLQPEIASRMGFVDKAGMSGVERFMKRYFLAAKEVGALTRILCAKLEAIEQKKPSGLLRFMPAPVPKLLDDKRFVLDAGRVSYASADAVKDDPLNLFRLFKVADKGGYDIHPNAIANARENLKELKVSYRKDPEAQELFIDVVTSKHHPGTTLKIMNETGVLGHFLPEFGRIVGQTQFNMYHHYTVDEHTIRAVEAMNDIERHVLVSEHPLATEIFPKVQHRRALYLAMLLHDTGKGQGDQQIEGAKTARGACLRLGMEPEEAELVAWLVGNHLEMSDTAQRRDISDPRTVSTFAKKVGTVERLRLLLILTVCDIRAVGPGVWNSWKGQLLRELYYATEAALRGGRADEVSVQAQIAKRATLGREALFEKIGKLPASFENLEDAYWISFETDVQAWHAETITASGGETTSAARIEKELSATQVLVFADDRARLYADLCKVLTSAGADILSARLFSTGNDKVLDVFEIQTSSGEPFCEGDPERLKFLTTALQAVAAGEKPEHELADDNFKASRRQAAFIVEPVVSIDKKASDNAIVLELSGRNRQGLMQEIANVFVNQGLSIQSAHAESYGMLVHDVFYVEAQGEDVLDEALLTKELLEVLRRGDLEAPRTPARALKRAKTSENR
ncbi:[protein-PII] uridylyltransferase [Hirschia baltica]|uniref:Bifunctional uridylyltransferase/uridylyl-removing enzyme n=1 Tax=Hirschia baltica (strain ATCC 49814 / DSM 5838 / IFAM 1418) TaxID=582402 RepID=C6XIF8_HIRBI|nr:[protein-PII] uridylyltransferase [Hirschia baltica]ACT60765.1 UTP-GlnB uridylyltransferase, GlnD [Hirschia baltica ATCC 49814]